MDDFRLRLMAIGTPQELQVNINSLGEKQKSKLPEITSSYHYHSRRNALEQWLPPFGRRRHHRINRTQYCAVVEGFLMYHKNSLEEIATPGKMLVFGISFSVSEKGVSYESQDSFLALKKIFSQNYNFLIIFSFTVSMICSSSSSESVECSMLDWIEFHFLTIALGGKGIVFNSQCVQ